ncbi:hypothetical protein FGO68_gene6020 [Halteria grandinella]|uniref:peptidylprolyl isomerase n=1 Tax=Halteria grandinella TaxID=5974 RepID=A0A8J8NCV1_HALGN|nr:hypothetical protein FGO68_gene6020 [Halteria grandinella]
MASYQFEVQTIQEGSGDQCPVGATAELHYTGRLLDGTVFDSSIPKNRTFKFKVGAGQVIKGWDQGVAQLRVGQKANIICPPNYAYGPAGIPGVIPQNATLIFEVELISFKM